METILLKTNCLKKHISDKAENWLNSFIEEAELFEVANEWEEFWRDYKEEPLLTLLATGLARNDSSKEISILREYPVSDSKGYVGASDLFLNYHKEQGNYYKKGRHFFIEAKYKQGRWETGFIDWSEDTLLKFINEVEKQMTFYIEAERIKEVESYTVIILFYVTNFKNEGDYLDYLNKVNNYKCKENQFYALLKSNNPKESAYKNFGILEVVGYIKEIL
ncbi:MAG: hypothetical protein WDM71_01070 [Ferruginibacter sp.]